MGTSLKVGGSVVEFIRRVERKVPQVLINKTSVDLPKEVESDGFDLELLGDCDDIVDSLTTLLGWRTAPALGADESTLKETDHDVLSRFSVVRDRVFNYT